MLMMRRLLGLSWPTACHARAAGATDAHDAQPLGPQLAYSLPCLKLMMRSLLGLSWPTAFHAGAAGATDAHDAQALGPQLAYSLPCKGGWGG